MDNNKLHQLPSVDSKLLVYLSFSALYAYEESKRKFKINDRKSKWIFDVEPVGENRATEAMSCPYENGATCMRACVRKVILCLCYFSFLCTCPTQK